MTWRERFESRDSALCIGLDPVPERLPAGVSRRDFCLAVVEATHALAACYKPNLAFFEVGGSRGIADLEAVLADLKGRGIPVILDAKRGDIGSTAERYAAAYLGDGPLACDAVTVNPSLGLDTLEPFRDAARANDRGVLVLLRTSNPGAPVFQAPAEPALIEALRAEPAFGAVVGATDPATGGRLRAALPETFFLVPGFGAQGGGDARPYFDAAGRGAVVNSSRAILYAGEGCDDWRRAVQEGARSAHATIQRARQG